MLDKKHFPEGCSPAQNGAAATSQQAVMLKKIAFCEVRVMKLCDLLNEAIERTKDNNWKNQASGYKEIEAEHDVNLRRRAITGSRASSSHYLAKDRTNVSVAPRIPLRGIEMVIAFTTIVMRSFSQHHILFASSVMLFIMCIKRWVENIQAKKNIQAMQPNEAFDSSVSCYDINAFVHLQTRMVQAVLSMYPMVV